MPAFNRALFLQRAALVGDTADVSADYAAAIGKAPAILDALVGQVVAVVAAKNVRLNLIPLHLFRLRQTVLLELGAVEGHIDFPVIELRGLWRILRECGLTTLYDFAASSEQDSEGCHAIRRPSGDRPHPRWQERRQRQHHALQS